MKNENSVLMPEIRFEGFTDAWIRRKLGEVTSVYDGTHQTPNYVNEGIMFLSVENIATLGSDKFISETDFEKEFKISPEFNDILMTRIGDIGTTNVVRTNKKLAYYVSLALLKPRNMDSDYLATLIQSFTVQKEIWERTLHVAFPKKINKGEIENIVLYITNKTEQTAIGKFFRAFDDTITLCKRRLDELKKLKSAYLQQMFPQARERAPRVRFSGFTGDWKEKKLGEISIKITEKNKNNEFSETFTNSAEYGIISQRDFFDKDISNKKNLNAYFIVRPDDFIYNPRISNFAPVGPIKRNLLRRTGVMSPLYYVFRIIDGNLSFIEKYFESVYWHDFMLLNGDSGVRSDRFNIKDNTFEEMPIPYPCIDEQIIIGNFFSNLDKQIAVQAQRLNKIKRLKSAYLQKMFI